MITVIPTTHSVVQIGKFIHNPEEHSVFIRSCDDVHTYGYIEVQDRIGCCQYYLPAEFEPKDGGYKVLPYSIRTWPIRGTEMYFKDRAEGVKFETLQDSALLMFK